MDAIKESMRVAGETDDIRYTTSTKMLKSKMKLMFTAFFNISGIVHMEFLPQGTTVNQHVYKEIL